MSDKKLFSDHELIQELRRFGIHQAADRITELKAEVERLKAGLSTARDIAHQAPELNVSNYDHDQVCELNTAMIEVHGELTELLKEPK